MVPGGVKSAKYSQNYADTRLGEGTDARQSCAH